MKRMNTFLGNLLPLYNSQTFLLSKEESAIFFEVYFCPIYSKHLVRLSAYSNGNTFYQMIMYSRFALIQSNMKRASLNPRKNEIQEKKFYVRFRNLKNCNRKAFGLGRKYLCITSRILGIVERPGFIQITSSEIMTWLKRRKTENRAKCWKANTAKKEKNTELYHQLL